MPDVKNRVGEESIFLKDNDWKVLKRQLLKLVNRVNTLELESNALKRAIASMCSDPSNNHKCPPSIERIVYLPSEDTTGFSFIL